MTELPLLLVKLELGRREEVRELLKDQVKVSAGGKLLTLQLTDTVSFSETPYTRSWVSSHTGASASRQCCAVLRGGASIGHHCSPPPLCGEWPRDTQ